MLVDPAIIVAQIINFLLLMWLLQRFLYKPIRRVIAQRGEAWRQRQEELKAQEEQARQAYATYTERLREWERARDQMWEEAKEEARRERARLLAEAAQEAKEARARFEETFELERRRMEASLQTQLIQQAVAVSGRILSSLADVSLADAVIATLERRLEEAAEGPGRLIDSAVLHAPGGPVVDVRTSFEPTSEQRLRLQTLAIRLVEQAYDGWDGVGAQDGEPRPEGPIQPRVRFHVDPNLLLGAAVEIGGTSISWSAADFLRDMEKEALTALQHAAGAAGDGSPGTGEAKARA